MNYKSLNFIPFILLFVGINFVYAQSDCGIYSLKNVNSGTPNTVDIFYENPTDANGDPILIDFVELDFRVTFSNLQTIIDITLTNNNIPSGIPIEVEQVGNFTNIIRVKDNTSGNFTLPDGKLATISFDLLAGECTDIDITNLGYFVDTGNGIGNCTASNTTIENIDNFCSGSLVSGTVFLVSNDDPVPNVDITFENLATNINEIVTSDNSGIYSTYLSPENYSITTEKDDDILCGVTTFDMVLIRKHLLNIELLDEPRKRIAANSNVDGSHIGAAGEKITTFDLVKIKRTLLQQPNGIDQDWAILAEPTISSLSNPPSSPAPPVFSEEVILNAQNNVPLYDFFAIKVGDVNDSCNDPLGENVGSITTERNITITSSGGAIGQEIQIPVYINSFINQSAFSLGIHFLNDVLEVTDILNGSLTVASPKGNAFEIHTDKRGFDMVWYDMNLNGVSSSFTPLFYIKATVLQPFVSLTGLVETDSSKVLNVIFPANNPNRSVERLVISNSLGGSLVEENSDGHLSTKQHNLVSPNPFQNELRWQLYSEKAKEVNLKIMDITGKVWLNIQRELHEGYNNIYLPNLQYLPVGLLHYQILSSDKTISGQILKIE